MELHVLATPAAFAVLTDAQDERPLCYCVGCGGEIYAYDRLIPLYGEAYHPGCAPEEELPYCYSVVAREHFDEVWML